MTIDEAKHVIDMTIPNRVLIAIAEGLVVGINKGYDKWDSDKGLLYYNEHREEHFGKLMAGEHRDPDGHHNASAATIRDMQILDATLLMEERCHGHIAQSPMTPSQR